MLSAIKRRLDFFSTNGPRRNLSDIRDFANTGIHGDDDSDLSFFSADGGNDRHIGFV